MTGRGGLLSRRAGQAMVSPSALVLLGAGLAVGLAIGLPVLAAVGLGLVAWAIRVAIAVARTPSTPKVRVNVNSLREPWRGFVVDAMAAKERYRRSVATMDEGSLRNHLDVVGQRIDRGVEEAQQIAKRGQQIDEALASIDVAACRQELAELRRSGETGVAADRTAEALQAQLDSAARMEAVTRQAKDQLRVMDARLGELVARAAEVSVSAGDTTDPLLAGDIDGLVKEMESLRVALDETRRGGAIDDPGHELRRARDDSAPPADGGTLPPPPGAST